MPNPTLTGKGAREVIDDATRRRHSAAEITIPPPSLDVELTPQAPRQRSIRPLEPAKVKEWIAVIVLAGTVAGNGLLWFQGLASKKDVADAETRAVATCASAIASALAPIPPRLKLIEKRATADEARWDELDKWHAKAPALNRPNTTKPPKFGPTAAAHGATTFDLGDEE